MQIDPTWPVDHGDDDEWGPKLVAGLEEMVAQGNAADAELGILNPKPAYASSATRRYAQAQSAYNVKASNTRRWRKGIAQAQSGGFLNELWIGDSILGGCTDVTGAGTFDRINAVAPQYARLRSAELGVPL